MYLRQQLGASGPGSEQCWIETNTPEVKIGPIILEEPRFLLLMLSRLLNIKPIRFEHKIHAGMLVQAYNSSYVGGQANGDLV